MTGDVVNDVCASTTTPGPEPPIEELRPSQEQWDALMEGLA
jgi:hypothetical protein